MLLEILYIIYFVMVVILVGFAGYVASNAETLSSDESTACYNLS